MEIGGSIGDNVRLWCRFVLLLGVLVWLPRPLLGRPMSCAADKYADGCSVPLGINAPFKNDFTPACNRHDICYGCGHHYNWSRADCDAAFYRNMKKICNRLHLRPKRLVDTLLTIWNFFRHLGNSKKQCLVSADIYYDGVRLFAQSHFDHIDHDYCTSKCADTHGNPHPKRE